jgi:hypothetical protein
MKKKNEWPCRTSISSWYKKAVLNPEHFYTFDMNLWWLAGLVQVFSDRWGWRRRGAGQTKAIPGDSGVAGFWKFKSWFHNKIQSLVVDLEMFQFLCKNPLKFFLTLACYRWKYGFRSENLILPRLWIRTFSQICTMVINALFASKKKNLLSRCKITKACIKSLGSSTFS